MTKSIMQDLPPNHKFLQGPFNVCYECKKPVSPQEGWGLLNGRTLICPDCRGVGMMNKAATPMEGFTFGCDPEAFVRDPDNNLISAAGLLPGTKEEPFKVEHGAVQVDGMAAEFNIDPVTNFDDFHRNLSAVIGQAKSMLPKGCSFDFSPAVRFSKEVMDAAPPEAKELGCCPDFNAWTGDVNNPPNVDKDPLLRTAAGHIHIGFPSPDGQSFSLDDPQHMMNCRDLVKQLDWYLGGWSLSMDPDPTRRLLYGKAGACRYKPYGVEYRVLSNFWLTTKERRLTVWNRSCAAITDMRNRFLPEYYPSELSDRLRSSIDNSAMDEYLRVSAGFPLRTLARW